MNEWRTDKRWADRYMPEIKGILGRVLIGAANEDEDREHNTDLIVLRMDAVRIAVRLRRAEYLRRYASEFTVRTSRPSGAKTELAKIIEGWGDYLFYGFADDGSDKLLAWGIGDLRPFRLWFNQQLARNAGCAPGVERPNGDESSKFRAFRWAELPPSFVVASDGIPTVAPRSAVMVA